jgi:predicted porin
MRVTDGKCGLIAINMSPQTRSLDRRAPKADCRQKPAILVHANTRSAPRSWAAAALAAGRTRRPRRTPVGAPMPAACGRLGHANCCVAASGQGPNTNSMHLTKEAVMKKSLIALAVLGAMVGGAQAQSSVTLYGKIDVSLMRNKVFGGTSQVTIESGTISGSRWGMMGSEDLGGGLKANFDLEQGFAVDTGAQSVAGNAFSRQSWVGLSGGFGEVRVGKPWTAYDDVSGAINAMFDSGFSVENNFFKSTGYTANPANTVRYSTPTFGGFSGAFSHSMDEVKNVNTDVNSVSIAYAGGPFAAGFGYQTEGLAAGGKTKYTRLSASYDLGAAVIKGLYGNVKNPGSFKTNEYSIGVDVPVSGALTVSAGYGYSKDNVASGDEKRKGLTLGAMYMLSKRTDVYVGLTDWDGKTAGTKTSGNTKYGFGMRHSF